MKVEIRKILKGGNLVNDLYIVELYPENEAEEYAMVEILSQIKAEYDISPLEIESMEHCRKGWLIQIPVQHEIEWGLSLGHLWV